MIEERIGDLVCDHVAPTRSLRPFPIVFQHGLWAGSWIFRDWLEVAAARGWDAWAPNFRGRAGSRPVEDIGRVGLEDFAQDLRDVLAAVGPAVVVGYSMGGLVTQMVAGDPSVRAVVLLASVPPRGIVGLSAPVLRRSWRYLPDMVANRPMLPNRADTEAMIMNAMSADERDRWFPMFIPDSGRVARQIATGAIAVAADVVDRPVLVVSAEHDHISPPTIQPKLAARYRADHLPVAGHGHLISIERGWESVAASVLDRVDTMVERAV